MKKFFAPVVAFLAVVFASLGERLNGAIFSHMQRSGLALCMDMPTASDFNARRVTNPDQSEVYRNRLYDYQLYATAGVSQLTFFSQPAGQGLTSALGSTAGTAKTLSDTNLLVSNTLPSGMAFMIESIEVPFWPGSVSTANTYTPANVSVFNAASSATLQGMLNDVNTFYQSGLLELNILQKNYLRETPLMAFPPKTYLTGSFAVSSDSATEGSTALVTMHSDGRPYYVEPNITLQPAVNFEVVLKWPAAVATPSGFNARVGVVLDGVFMRASQ